MLTQQEKRAGHRKRWLAAARTPTLTCGEKSTNPGHLAAVRKQPFQQITSHFAGKTQGEAQYQQQPNCVHDKNQRHTKSGVSLTEATVISRPSWYLSRWPWSDPEQRRAFRYQRTTDPGCGSCSTRHKRFHNTKPDFYSEKPDFRTERRRQCEVLSQAASDVRRSLESTRNCGERFYKSRSRRPRNTKRATSTAAKQPLAERATACLYRSAEHELFTSWRHDSSSRRAARTPAMEPASQRPKTSLTFFRLQSKTPKFTVVGIREISRLGSAFTSFCDDSNLHISLFNIQVPSLNRWNKQGINQQIFNWKSISRNTKHRQSLHLIQTECYILSYNFISYSNFLDYLLWQISRLFVEPTI